MTRSEGFVDKVAIDDEQIIPMENVAPGVRGLRIAFVNVYALTHPDGSWSLIDAALPFSASPIKNWAEKHFSTPPNSLILTHGHFDHVSAAKDLAESWDIPVYAHLLEFPYLTGQKEYPKPNVQAGGGMMTLLSPLYPRSPIDIGERLVALPNEDSVAGASDSGSLPDLPGLPGWQILHTPGHTPGHVSFFRPADRTLIVGDAFCTTKPESFFEAAVAQNAELHGPPSYFTSDWTAASASVRRLAGLDPVTVAPGHGKPLGGPDVASALRKLAAAFENIAVPDNVR
jgi:glyoxylase-like metal-dependent hydrolase (beta-lactamase superfamily II)